MFNLIIVIISIALGAVVTLASVSYLGDAFSEGSAQAKANEVLTQGQQIMAAVDLYRAKTGGAPADMAALVSDYLKSAPADWTLANNSGDISLTFTVGSAEICTAINEGVGGTPCDTGTRVYTLN
jgi:hypothetical protein